jgi:hypothetical protein
MARKGFILGNEELDYDRGIPEGPAVKRILLALAVLASTQALSPQTDAPRESPSFEPAEVLSVTDLTVPIASMASGTVVLDAVLNDKGEVQKVENRRRIPSLTEAAVSSLEGWKFSPAMIEGKAVASRIPVAVTVRPALQFVEPIPLPPLEPQTDAQIQAEFQPAEVLHAVIPTYSGNNAVYSVTVVLEAALSESGKVKNLKVICDAPGASSDAVAAVADWRFMPATLNGHPVPSKIVLAFVFRPPSAWLPE